MWPRLSASISNLHEATIGYNDFIKVMPAPI